jgi:hypothetical protein
VLEKDPARRPQGPDEMRNELASAESGPAPAADEQGLPAPAETSRAALFFAERFQFGDYFLAGAVLFGIQKLPVSERLRSLLMTLALLLLAGVVIVGIRALRGTARGFGLQCAAAALGAAFALLACVEVDLFLSNLLGISGPIANSDRWFTWITCGTALLFLSWWTVRSSRLALAAFENRRRWRLWLGSAAIAVLGALLAYSVLQSGKNVRRVPMAILGVFFVVDFWSGRRDGELGGPLVRGRTKPEGWAVKVEIGGKRDVKWVRALRDVTGCSLALAAAARRTSAEWLVGADLEQAAARDLAERLTAAGIAARALDAAQAGELARFDAQPAAPAD